MTQQFCAANPANPTKLATIDGTLEAAPPNVNIYDFKGNFRSNGMNPI